ncbi:cell surface protein [Carnobacterium divergens]|nr:cell surface protein [Carnobacterium divergens]TFJ51993.1 cell surface protein [Carnobacterium divergens]
MPISVNAVLPENQFNKQVSYFYLKMEPGDEQEIELKLGNSSNEDQKVEVTLTPAITNDNGIIAYPDDVKKVDSSLVHPFTSIATTDKDVTVPANSETSVKIKLKMPTEEYEGMIAGGINVKLKETKDDAEKKNETGMKIKNVLTYNIGVVLVENETIVVPEMKLNKVFAGQVMGTNTIKTNLSNTKATPIEELEIAAKIYTEKGKEPLFEEHKKNLRMAPNSNFNFGVGLGNQAYKAGNYRIVINAKSDPADKKWSFEKEFTIDRETAKKLNATASDLEKDNTLYYIIGGSVLLILLIVLLYFIKRYKANQKKKREQERKRRKAHAVRKQKAANANSQTRKKRPTISIRKNENSRQTKSTHKPK